jgi:hypothetical protein
VVSKIKESVLLLFLSWTLVFLLFPNTAYASPGTTTVDARPTAHAITGGVSVTSPASAYDGNTGTAATFDYDPDVAGTFEVKTFSTPSSDTILIVDFKMNYAAAAGGTGEEYRIVYYVGTSGPVVLQTWTSNAHTQATETWADQAEPKDGTWSWKDISDIRFIVETTTGGGKAAGFEEYEAWVTVTTYTYTKGTISVNPASLTDPGSPFTVDIDIASVEDLYGWEFKLYYNNTILSNSTVNEENFLSNQGTTFFSVIDNTDTYNATHGRFWVTCTLTGDVSGGTGSGTLANITLTVDGPGGTTALAFVDTKLVGYEFSTKKLVQLEHYTSNGSVTISGVPEFPLGAALEISLVGVIVYIWWRGKRKQPRRMLNTVNMPPK